MEFPIRPPTDPLTAQSFFVKVPSDYGWVGSAFASIAASSKRYELVNIPNTFILRSFHSPKNRDYYRTSETTARHISNQYNIFQNIPFPYFQSRFFYLPIPKSLKPKQKQPTNPNQTTLPKSPKSAHPDRPRLPWEVVGGGVTREMGQRVREEARRWPLFRICLWPARPVRRQMDKVEFTPSRQ